MRKLKLGAVGVGRAFSLMAPAFRDPRIELVAVCDPRADALRQAKQELGAQGFSTLQEMLEKSAAEAVYIATPHQFHAEQAVLACRAGKHVLVEKPMALTMQECRAMTAAARKSGVHLIVGHSHSFDAPVLHARALISSGAFGAVKMITAINYTDFLYRPRRPEELDTAQGGGAVFNQAAHQVDVVRLLAGSPTRSVRAMTGAWDPARPTEGAYSALLTFESGAFAHLTYSGYAHFDSDEFMGWIGELGDKKDPAAYGAARKRLASAKDELALKSSRNYGGGDFSPARPAHHEHFGVLVVSCEKADLRPTPEGVQVYGDGEKRLDPVPASRVHRAAVIDELYDAAVNGRTPLHGGEWATATLEVCLAILDSARQGKELPSGKRKKG
jgi:phthalate 4,5-cis-dihydrodiol dehydrogenase